MLPLSRPESDGVASMTARAFYPQGDEIPRITIYLFALIGADDNIE